MSERGQRGREAATRGLGEGAAAPTGLSVQTRRHSGAGREGAREPHVSVDLVEQLPPSSDPLGSALCFHLWPNRRQKPSHFSPWLWSSAPCSAGGQPAAGRRGVMLTPIDLCITSNLGNDSQLTG